ncbi:MAG: hypothetical protein ABIN67_10795 [Ferruginibacter sp.]
METLTLENDITIFYITASSFPAGIMEAHQKLHTLVPFSTTRKYYGISRPENGVIVYKAAAEELHAGEAAEFNCDSLVLKKGKYICTAIHDYMKDVESIRNTFKEMLEHPNLDPEGYCVEWYLSKEDVNCMIRLNE